VEQASNVEVKTVHVRARYYADDEDALVMLKAIAV
jgi:hypothetical protein